MAFVDHEAMGIEKTGFADQAFFFGNAVDKGQNLGGVLSAHRAHIVEHLI